MISTCVRFNEIFLPSEVSEALKSSQFVNCLEHCERAILDLCTRFLSNASCCPAVLLLIVIHCSQAHLCSAVKHILVEQPITSLCACSRSSLKRSQAHPCSAVKHILAVQRSTSSHAAKDILAAQLSCFLV